jgi:hypothetical protein
MTTWICAECEARNPDGAESRFCPKCGTARVTALNTPEHRESSFRPPWERPGWKASKPEDHCDVEGCTKTVREHIDECLAITSRPGTVFTRPSQRATTPADPDPAREARRQELLAQAREILKAGEI